MRTNVIIVDDFYTDPVAVRDFAMSQNFEQQGNFPGRRTESFLTESAKETVARLIEPHAGQVTDWNASAGLTGSFEIATSRNRSWVHTDHFNTWAGVCYLTPDAPVSGGTGLFMYKPSGSMLDDGTDYSYDTQDMTKWQLVDQIGNRFNRLVMYRSDIYHTSMDYFGKDVADGRLFQLFFLNTEY